MKSILAAALLFIPSFADAAPVVRICQQVCYGDHCKRTWQTGTIIGRDDSGKLAILTCKHGYDQTAKLYVQIEQGAQFEEGEWKARDDASDLALIVIDHPEKAKWYPVGEDTPNTGTTVTVGGFALAKTLRPRNTTVKTYSGDGFDVEDTFSQGESGGPAIDLNGKLVGVIMGNDLPTFLTGQAPVAALSDGHLTCLSRIRVFVKARLGCIPAPRQPLKPVPQTEPLPPPTGTPQVSALQSQIDALLARIAALEGKQPPPASSGLDADNVQSMIDAALKRTSSLTPQVDPASLKTAIDQAVSAAIAKQPAPKDGAAGAQGPAGVVTVRLIDAATGQTISEKTNVKSGSVVPLNKTTSTSVSTVPPK